jgi:chemotaxis protein methyltransferase CheR
LKREILRRLRGRLKPGGSLLLGASETTLDLGHCYQMEYCNPGVIHRAC